MTGPRIGSRVWKLSQLAPGESALFEAPDGKLTSFMQQLGVDMRRCDIGSELKQSLILGIEPSTRRVFEIVRVTRGAGL